MLVSGLVTSTIHLIINNYIEWNQEFIQKRVMELIRLLKQEKSYMIYRGKSSNIWDCFEASG